VLEFFRRNLFLNVLLIVPYLIFIRLATLIYPTPNIYEYTGSSILVGSIYELLANPFVQSSTALILVFIQVLLINNICIKHRLASETTLLAGIAYIVLVSLSSPLLALSPIYFANLFMLLAISHAFDTYKNTKAVGNIFATGFFIAVAAIFHPPFIVFVLWGFIALITLHSFKWKEKLQYFSGIGVAFYLLYGFVYFFYNGLTSTISNFYAQLGLFQFQNVGPEEWITIALYCFIFIIVFFSYNSYGQKTRVEVQKKIDILFWYMVFCIPAVVFSQLLHIRSLLIIAPVISILIGINLTRIKNKTAVEIVHIIIIGAIIYTHFFMP
jgi:hypothetical protein